MKENFDIFDFALSSESMEQIDQLARPDGRLIRPEWEPEWDTAEEGHSAWGADLPRAEELTIALQPHRAAELSEKYGLIEEQPNLDELIRR